MCSSFNFQAALEALKKDLKSDPSMAAQYGIQIDPDKKINCKSIMM